MNVMSMMIARAMISLVLWLSCAWGLVGSMILQRLFAHQRAK